MSKQFLRITNPGVASTEVFTLLGASTTRNAGVDGTTGTFGSGVKHAVRLFLTHGIEFVIYCGLARLSFFTRSVSVADDLGSNTFDVIHYRVSGTTQDNKNVNRVEKTSLTLQYGVHDWTELEMGLREIVSNAIDRSRREYVARCDMDNQLPDPIRHLQDITIDVVSESQVRASVKETRVYIEYTPTVEKFHNQLGKRFLHFSEPELLTEMVLPKTNRNPNGGRGAAIYREGVFVRSIEGSSLFDYNFSSALEIDEARKLSDYTAITAVSKAIRDSESGTIATVLEASATGFDCLETQRLESWTLCSDYGSSDTKEKRRERWDQAFSMAFGDQAVACSLLTADLVARKGHKPVQIQGALKDALGHYGSRVDLKLLEDHEQQGYELIDPTLDVKAAVDDVWALIELCGMTRQREKPRVHCFNHLVEADATTYGICDSKEWNYIAINMTIATGRSPMLLKTVLHELTHAVTRERDGTTAFQDFGFKFSIAVSQQAGLL